MDHLNDAEFGRLVRALMIYSTTGQEIELRGNERNHWKRVKNREDRYRKSFTDKSEARREAGKAGAAARWQNDGKNGKRILLMANDSKNGNTGAYTGAGAKTDTKADTEDKIEDICAEPEKSVSPPVAVLPLVDGTVYEVTQADCQQWVKAYPAVDVLRALDAMRSWLDANPKNRKTRAGIKRFIVSWLSRDQDRAPRVKNGQAKEGWSFDDF